MSFSTDLKAELLKQIPSVRHCQIAELTAMSLFAGKVSLSDDLKQKYFTLKKKTIIIDKSLTDENEDACILGIDRLDPLIIRNLCCKRAFLRGAFLCVGTMTDPQKGYQLEFVCEKETQAVLVSAIIDAFDIEAKILKRRKSYVTYVKDGSSIAELLSIIGGRLSVMEFENLRVEREVRNAVNRKVNCEAANISKTVVASKKQQEDIIFLRDHYGFDKLPTSLKEMAEIRLAHPESSLVELGSFFNPPVGKSGVNHRLRKLSQMADYYRDYDEKNG